jgi:hypothetical protein
VKLKVVDKDDNYNTFIKDVYIGESDYPMAFIDVGYSNDNNVILYEDNACN